MIRAVLFDFDGVLVDSDEAVVRAWKSTFLKFRQPVPSAEQIIFVTGKTSCQCATELLPVSLKNDLKLADEIGSAAEAAYVGSYFPRFAKKMPGITELLQQLSAKGIKSALVTNALHATAEKNLQSFGFTQISEIVGADDAGKAKPSPEPLLLALRKLGASPDEAIYVGDTSVDEAAGAGAGVKTVIVANSRNPGVLGWKRVNSLSEIAELL